MNLETMGNEEETSPFDAAMQVRQIKNKPFQSKSDSVDTMGVNFSRNHFSLIKEWEEGETIVEEKKLIEVQSVESNDCSINEVNSPLKRPYLSLRNQILS